MTRRSYKYRLCPTRKQAQTLQWIVDRCRELYNAALQERRDAYRMAGKSINYYNQANQLPEIKEVREEYREIHSQVQQDVLKRVEKTYKRFFERCKRGETPGFPRWKGRGVYNSFTYPQGGYSLTHDNRVSLSKIGSIKVKFHREMQGKVKTCTIKHEGEHWYVVFSCEVEVQPKLAYTDEAVGMDLGTYHFAALSTGDIIDNPRHYRKAEKKIQKLHQACARKKKGSHRRKKAYKKLSTAYRKVRNQRCDFLHKWSRILVDTYDTLVFEDLQTHNMSRRPKPKQGEDGNYLPNGAAAKGGLNKSILDAGWGQFQQYCSYKAANAGREVLFVNPHKTSQVCSGCGAVRKKDLSERWHSCECGAELDRDHNAALNILVLGQKQFTGGKRPTRAIA